MKLTTWRLFLVILAGVAMMSVGALSDEAQTTGIQVGELAPDFTLPVVGVDGERVNLYEQIEQYDVILLYYFLAAS